MRAQHYYEGWVGLVVSGHEAELLGRHRSRRLFVGECIAMGVGGDTTRKGCTSGSSQT